MIKTVIFAVLSFLLSLVFIALKNHSVIDWSWWWVFSPIVFFYLSLGIYIIYKGVKR